MRKSCCTLPGERRARRSSFRPGRIAITAWAALVAGCFPSTQSSGPTIDQMIAARDDRMHSPQRLAPGPAGASARSQALADPAADQSAIAVIDGNPVPRAAVIELLMRSHGLNVLEQLIGLETARRLAESRGLVITEADIQAEYDLALRKLVDPLQSVTPAEFDRPAAEKLLGAVLAERNMSRDEFLVILRRNAHLRKVVEREQKFTEDDLRAEYDRRYGRRAQVRHIQLGSQADLARVQERQAAGEDFADLAARYSANTASGRRQGLLEPFSVGDQTIPEPFRQAAFALSPGEVSSPVRIGAWEHLIKLERILEPQDVEYAAVRSELEGSLRERVSDAQMQQLHERLFRSAVIDIQDPTLRAAFENRYPDLRPAGR